MFHDRTCECSYFTLYGKFCKHLWAVTLLLASKDSPLYKNTNRISSNNNSNNNNNNTNNDTDNNSYNSNCNDINNTDNSNIEIIDTDNSVNNNSNYDDDNNYNNEIVNLGQTATKGRKRKKEGNFTPYKKAGRKKQRLGRAFLSPEEIKSLVLKPQADSNLEDILIDSVPDVLIDSDESPIAPINSRQTRSTVELF